MKTMKYFLLLIIPVLIWSCSNQEQSADQAKEVSEFEFKADRFADVQILRYQVPGFEELDLAKKKLVYYLYQAALSGRDIIWDQNYRHNLRIRRTLEAIITSYPGDREEEDFLNFMTYAKRIWFSNGIHHHYSTWKILPEFSSEYFHQLVHETDSDLFPLLEGESKHELVEKLIPAMFDPNLDAKRVNLSDDVDNIDNNKNY